jgi:hypothetical protein
VFLTEYWTEVLQVDMGVCVIPFFRVDVLQSIGLGSQLPEVELDDKIELREVFRPSDLVACQQVCGREVFKVLVVCNNINQSHHSFEVLLPDLECVINCQEFLVMSVVI